MIGVNPPELAASGAPTRLAVCVDDPLVFLASSYRSICGLCADIKAKLDLSPRQNKLAGLIESLKSIDLPPLIADILQDLLPLMSVRANPEDNLSRLAERLTQDLTGMEATKTALVRECKGLTAVAAAAPSPALDPMITAFQRPLMLTNAVLIPLARLRLTATDMQMLRTSIMTRHGLGAPASN